MQGLRMDEICACIAPYNRLMVGSVWGGIQGMQPAWGEWNGIIAAQLHDSPQQRGEAGEVTIG